VTVGGDGSLSAIASATGKTVWQIDLRSLVVATPYFNESGIEIATNRNEVVNVSGTDGRVHVDWKSKYLPTAVLVDSNGRLVVGDERGNFVSVSSGGSRLWGFRNGAQISSATLYGSEYLAASYDNFLYKLSRSGDVKWKRRLSGRVNDGPFVLADTAIVSIVGTGSVYVIDLKKGKISNRIEGGEEVSLRVVAATNASGFAVAGPSGISYFSSARCPAK
jgi:outer membrane protein assembly factor BamB